MTNWIGWLVVIGIILIIIHRIINFKVLLKWVGIRFPSNRRHVDDGTKSGSQSLAGGAEDLKVYRGDPDARVRNISKKREKGKSRIKVLIGTSFVLITALVYIINAQSKRKENKGQVTDTSFSKSVISNSNVNNQITDSAENHSLIADDFKTDSLPLDRTVNIPRDLFVVKSDSTETEVVTPKADSATPKLPLPESPKDVHLPALELKQKSRQVNGQAKIKEIIPPCPLENGDEIVSRVIVRVPRNGKPSQAVKAMRFGLVWEMNRKAYYKVIDDAGGEHVYGPGYGGMNRYSDSIKFVSTDGLPLVTEVCRVR